MIDVLVVDDDRFARMGLISLIPWENYEMRVVGEASNGRRALEFLQNNRVDLMFVDISMPVMDGMQLIRAVREEFKNIYFVVLSFHEEFEYVQEALRLEALDYISKDKMEMDDYDRILTRICKRIARYEIDESDDNDENLFMLERQLDGVLWLYCNYQMRGVEELLASSTAHIHSLEKLLAAVTARVSAETQVQFPRVLNLENMEMAVQYLRTCRLLYREGMEIQSDTVYARLMQAAMYVWDHSAEQLQAEEVAQIACYSRSYFAVTFKKILGITFSAFVRRERVLNAINLMQQTRMPQSEVARRCGYGDVSNFKKALKEVTGGFSEETRRFVL